MNISPVSNTSFNGLHIVRSNAMKQFVEEAVDSDNNYNLLSDTFKKMDEKAGENSVYLTCKLQNDKSRNGGMEENYHFDVTDCSEKSLLNTHPVIHKNYASGELGFFCKEIKRFDVKMSDKIQKYDFFTKYN